MPYISTQEIATIRENIKKEFSAKSGWKFSVSREHYSTVKVVVKKAPISMENGQVNHYWIDSHYADKPAERWVLKRLVEIMSSDQKELDCDGDYGSVPNYYIGLAVDIN